MKQLILVAFASICFFSISNTLQAQNDSIDYVQSKLYFIRTHDDIEFIGKILNKDEREVLIETEKGEKIAIPRYKVAEIKEVKSDEYSRAGFYIPEEVFHTRYVLSTNGMALEQGDSYVIWNLFGPDFQFGIGKNLSLGLITTWIGAPVLATLKYSIKISDQSSFGAGILAGSGVWVPDFYVVLPFGALTLGNKRNNITFSGGYGTIGSNDVVSQNTLFSLAMMARLGKNASFVFDSFIVPYNEDFDNTIALVVPALRIQTSSKKAFQIGFAGVVSDNQASPIAIPMLQWFRKF